MIDFAARTFGRLDILINNAGAAAWSALSEDERWRRQPPIPLERIGDQVMECIRDDRLAGAVLMINADRSVRRLTSVGGF